MASITIPYAVADFIEMRERGFYYVDKTQYIAKLEDYKAPVFLRPRRFGKSLLVSTLACYYDRTKAHRFEELFGDTWIGNHPTKEHNRYMIIRYDFSAMVMSDHIQGLAQNFNDLNCGPVEVMVAHNRDLFGDFEFSNRGDASKMLEEVLTYARSHELPKVYILIDEYDTPIQQSYTEGYYEQITGFMRNLLSGAFKDNSNLSYGFLTGILRVAKESTFSGLNNLKVNSILEDRYSEYFGFTKDEIRGITEYYGRTDKYEEICEWYDGYRFGDTDIFNPWSVLNYMDENCSAKAYWQSTGDNSIIRQIVAEADDETADNLRKLMQGQMVSSYVDTSVIYPEIRNNPTTIYSFLLSAGYLKVVKKDELHDGNAICDIAIPNKEIFYVYEKEILSALTNMVSQSTAIAIQQAIIKQDVPKLQDNLQKLLLNSISSFDYAHENFYHGLILGICAIMNNLYHVDPNRESGHGRYDIQLRPYNNKMPGIIIELKVLKDGVTESRIDTELEASAKEALAQIERQQYVTAMKQQGITHFFKVGVSFYKKHVKLLSDTE